MTITLAQCAVIIQYECAPLGAVVTVDGETDNLLVEQNGIGFVITRHYLTERGPFATAVIAREVVELMKDLRATIGDTMHIAHPAFITPMRVLPIAELKKRSTLTAFDDVVTAPESPTSRDPNKPTGVIHG